MTIDEIKQKICLKSITFSNHSLIQIMTFNSDFNPGRKQDYSRSQVEVSAKLNSTQVGEYGCKNLKIPVVGKDYDVAVLGGCTVFCSIPSIFHTSARNSLLRNRYTYGSSPQTANERVSCKTS